ncbi:MAG: endonuclease III domain-containing protein [Phycisphaerales bacterium]|nr:endonuclease III domain-containing protein [Phycisphaerales bacterium]MBT7171713.1 endonuclease III domain-containing protein [Phycisphaerales bacterium]
MADKLMAMYDAMRARFGHRDWWPGDGPLEICVGAILTQNTNWSNVERAIGNLKRARVLSLRRLAALERGALAELIRPAGYFNVKAERLGNFIDAVVAAGGLAKFFHGETAALRERLLAIKGIGPETADSILLYAAGRTAVVVDAYTGRLFRRHGLISPDEKDYHAIQALFLALLPADAELFNDYHAQIVETGKQFCKPRPNCADCPLRRWAHDETLK